MSYRTRKRKEVEERKVNDGEQNNFFTDEMEEKMETMWEIPQIFHFLHLTKESLNIPQLSLYEMERMLLIPRASKQLANIMTCLLSSPTTKAKLRKVPPMPYEFWTNILAYKMTSWFKVYRTKHEDATKVLEIIGVEPNFWNIFPEASMLDGKDFEDLSFKQRVWLLKTVCDTIMHTRKTVQEDIMNQPWEDQFETVLGIDRNGARYIYFPQFMPNDLRIYRHSLENKILSTVKPFRQGREAERSKFIRYRKKKLQMRNNLSDHRSNNHENKNDNKNDDKDLSNNDSAIGSFISEDTNLSSTSTCSNNNNNISPDTIRRKRRRSSSKVSEENSLSNARSSGYDTHTSSDNKSVDESSRMFKGFTNTQNDNCNIGIINEMLDDLRTEIDEEEKTTERESNSELVSQENFVELYKNTAVSHSEALDIEKEDNDRSSDNLSNSSKTDDEKLNEIINADSSKLPEDVYSKSISASDNVSDISTLTSKSDDEKLSETKTSDSNVSASENSLNKKRIFNELFYASSSVNSTSLSEEVAGQYLIEMPSMIEAKSNNSPRKRNLRKEIKLRSRNIVKQSNKKHVNKPAKNEMEEERELEDDRTNEADEETLDANETQLQTSVEYDLDDYTNNTDSGYICEDLKTDECKQRFDKMLSDLSVSDFYLVANSAEELRDLIATFSESDSESNNSNNVELIPLCEVKLVKRLTDLLSSVEPIETTLKDSMRKAKAKLQREWSNFKEGSVEDQDSSGESGLSSNWWVLGSQGRDPLSTPGDATLQALSQSALSPLSTQNTQKQSQPSESERESTAKNTKQSNHESREASNERRSGSDKKSDVEALPGKNQIEEEGKKQKDKQCRENESASNDEDTEQETQRSRRVLRARGVSSYTEPLYSDDESNEDELEEWTDVEAVYAAPGTQANTSASHPDSKERNADNWSDEEDSDQDWILPSSRKRKNKRSSINRRLKSFEHKLQNITENGSQSNTAFDASQPANAKIIKDKLKDKLKDNKVREPNPNAIDSQISGSTVTSAADNKNSKRTVPFTDTICKIESVKSVHSELDIKDESPIYETNPTSQYEQSNYGPSNPQQSYYYMMPQNPGIAPQGMVIQGGVPQTPHSAYYVQQPYMIPPPQGKYLPVPQQQQQLVYQQQNLQMVGQPYANNTNYYVTVTTPPQTAYMVAPGQMTNQPIPQNPVHCAPRPQIRHSQNNKYAPRQNSLHPNGATPRASGPRLTNSKNVKGDVPSSRPRQRTSQTSGTENSGQKVTSLIMLSDSDDEIEMIIMEKTPTTEKATPTNRDRSSESQRIVNQKQKPTITSDIIVPSTKGILSPQIIQRMSQGGISITPVKNNPPPTVTNANTQLVVVVNETGSHYALALPNGSKLILTPDQVAQIRASNGGKLIL